MGASDAKYIGVPETNAAFGVGVPMAAAVTTTGLGDNNMSSLPTASKVNSGDKNKNEEEREDGVTITWEKGEVQPEAYRDKGFAVAFIAHLVGVVGSAIVLGLVAWNELASSEDGEDGSASDENYYGNSGDDAISDGSTSGSGSTDDDMPPKEFWFAIVAIALVAAPALSFAALTVMNKNAIGLIKASLWISVVLCGLSAVLLMMANPVAGVFYGIFTVCLIWYARSVQNRIPYAASNLKCGITVLKSNLGLGLVALGSMVGLLLYSFGWVLSFFGTMQLDAMKDTGASWNDEYSNENSSGDSSDLSPLGSAVAFFFVLSFYWTHQVLKNIVRVTVSGVVGTWWFTPAEAGSFCSTAVAGSFIRSTTYSLGSICFGSLIVAILQMLRDSLRRAQNDRNGGILRCVAMCILSYIERLVEYFNKWAYVYVGLYGYGYIDAGKKVINLFKTRGWTTIIADNLVNRLLGIMSLTIGLLTGVCSLFAAFLVEEFESKQGWVGIGFVVGFFIGILLSGVFMGLLSSAVDAVIVCYAEAPKELEDSHPAIAQEMSRTWTEAWGEGVCGPVIVGLGGGLGIV